MDQEYHLTLVSSNNYFGQHHFCFNTNYVPELVIRLEKMVWFKVPKIVIGIDKIDVFCFNNYDKAAIEREFINE